MKKNLILLFFCALFALCGDPEYAWKNIGTPQWKDAEQRGLFNLSPVSVLSESGGLHPLLWSVRNVAEPTPRFCVYDPVFHANTSLNAGWNSGTGGAVDPVQPFLQFDFPSTAPAMIERLIFWSKSVEAPIFRPPFLVERKLNGKWRTVFVPKSRRDVDAAIIRFQKPFPANALRVRFINPSPSSYLLMRRFWIFAGQRPKPFFQGGRLDYFSADGSLKNVFPEGTAVQYEAVFTPDYGNPKLKGKFRFEVVDYYGNPVKNTIREFPGSGTVCENFKLRFDGLKPGAYHLKTTFESNGCILFRHSHLFGIQGKNPLPKGLTTLPRLARPAFEFTGGIGQNNGPMQRQSNAAIAAYRNLGVNTIQIEMLWRDIEPLPGVFEFRELDRIFITAAKQGYHIGISLYATDGNLPDFLHDPAYAMLDQYGLPAVGRTEWFMLLQGPSSSHAPIFRKHYFEVWKQIVMRYAPSRRVIRYDLRPSLCERFYFDDFVNYFCGTDNVCDFSEWARRDWITYLRDVRKYSLNEISLYSGEKFSSWEKVRFPKPGKGARAQELDRRKIWLDFLDFKNVYHPAEFFRPTVEMIAEKDPEARIFMRFPYLYYDRLLSQRKIAGGYFDIEHGVPYFTLNAAESTSMPRCFEWGDPAPGYLRLNAGLFNILPQLSGNSLRWVYQPCLDQQEYNVPEKWKAFESLSRLAPHLQTIVRYRMKPGRIALFGGFDLEFSKTESARPIRSRGQADAFSTFQAGNYRGLYAGLYDLLTGAGFAPFEDFRVQTKNKPLLVIDGGNADVPESQVRALLEYIRNGGKALLWSNSCRFDQGKRSDLLRKTLGITGKFQNPGTGKFMDSFDADHVFTGISVPEGKPFGYINSKPAAWEIPFGKGLVYYINGLPASQNSSQWRRFFLAICRKAGVTPVFQCPVPGICGYPLSAADGSRMLVIFNNSPEKQTSCRVVFPDVLLQKRYGFSRLHASEKFSKLIRAEQKGKELSLELNIASRDLLIIKAEPLKKGYVK